MSDMFLPDDLIFQILIRLPIKTLLRFKCVCRIWRSTIEDPIFIDRHMKRGLHLEPVYKEDQDTEYSAVITVRGVTLETRNSNYKRRPPPPPQQRLRNHATREILNLPSAPPEGGRKGNCTTMSYILQTNELKVVYIDSMIQGNGNNVLIYNILSLGTDSSKWKRFDSSFLCNRRNVVRRTSRLGGTVFYNMRFTNQLLYIECLDLENETITSIEVPRHSFYDSEHIITHINWNGKLALASVEQEELNVRVLEDHMNREWVEISISIPSRPFVDFLSPDISIKDVLPCSVHDNLIHWTKRTSCRLFSFDTRSKKFEWVVSSSTQREDPLFLYVPSLLPLRFNVGHLKNEMVETQRNLLVRFIRRVRKVVQC
ncbi:hypothetical protein OROHE_019610 [Orobanche hederae]